MSNNNVTSETQFCLFLFILWLFSTLLIKYLLNSINSTKPIYKLPPSPPSLPLLGHLHHLFSSHLYKAFHTLSSKHGPLLYLRLGSSKTLLVSSSNHATQVFKTLDLCFSSRPNFYFVDKILYGTAGFISAPYGDYWRFMKRLCVTELLGQRQVEQSRSIRCEELHKFIKKMMAGAEKLELVDVGAELMRLTNNVVCRTSMSVSCSDDADEAAMVRKLVKESFKLAGKLYIGEMVGPLKGLVLWLYGKKASEMTKKFDGLLERIVVEHEERMSQGKLSDNHHKDLMDIVLEVYKDENAGVKITRENVKAFFIDLIIAGTDTSSQTMQWVIAELINHPTILKKVEQEISQALGSDQTRLIQESDIPKLPYLTAVIKETLRLHPPGPIITRLCREACEIDGYEIPRDTPVAVNLYTIMRDPEAWDRPNEFRPERFLFLDQNDDVSMISFQYKMNDVKFIPFGAGRRGCPGMQLAYALMVPVLAATVQCFDWKTMAASDQKPPSSSNQEHMNGDGDMDDDCKVNMKPRSGLSLGMANSLKYCPVVRFNPFV